MDKKKTMKKRILFLVIALLVATGLGISSGRKYVQQVVHMARAPFEENDIFLKDTLSMEGLKQHYLGIRNLVEVKRKSLSGQYQAAATAEAQQKVLKTAGIYLHKVLTEKIYPCWYGTEWDFNGITETPNEGKIACGYFVSTTLKHVGVKVNRYKLAQKYSHAIVKTICTDVQVLSSFETLMKTLHDGPDDVYVVGLDNHVGMISKEGTQIRFIHSSYVSPSYVQSETAESSLVLGNSNLYVLGNMTANKALISAWLSGTTIKIVD